MKIAIHTNGGYVGFRGHNFKRHPIIVDAVPSGNNGSAHVKVADLELLGVYSSAAGLAQVDGACPDYNPDYSADVATLFFMAHEFEVLNSEVQKFGKVKVRILHDSGYPFRPEHNRTFPVIVNGYRDEDMPHCVHVNEADARAIGMYVDGFDATFLLAGNNYEADAEIL